MPFLESLGASLHYEIADGLFPRDILFIHGNLASNLWWQPALSEWKFKRSGAEKYPGRAVFMEWRGFGKSSAPNTSADLTIERLAQDSLSLVNFLGMHRPGLIGHSMGGGIALQAILDSPGTFDSALLLNPVPSSGYYSSPKQLALIDRMRVDQRICFTVMASTILNAHKIEEDFLERIAADAFGAANLNWRGVPEQTMSFNLQPRLNKVTIPIALIHGEHDHICSLADSEKTVSLIPGAQLIKVPTGGHSLNVENPKEFVRLADEFFQA